MDMGGWEMGIYPTGRFPAGSGAGDNGDIHPHMPEYVCAVNCNVTNYRPVYGGRAEAGLAGTHAVVGTGGAGIHRTEGGGGGKRVWGGGQGQIWRDSTGGGGGRVWQ